MASYDDKKFVNYYYYSKLGPFGSQRSLFWVVLCFSWVRIDVVGDCKDRIELTTVALLLAACFGLFLFRVVFTYFIVGDLRKSCSNIVVCGAVSWSHECVFY